MSFKHKGQTVKPKWRARIRHRIYDKLPRVIRNHDFEVFAAILGVVGGLPLMLGQVEPRSANDLLPEIIVRVWGAVLTWGSVTTIVGLLMANRTKFPDRAFWLRVEALGLTAWAYFCYLYCICIWGTALHVGWVSSIIILAFGLLSHAREIAIQVKLEEFRAGLGLEEKV